MRSVEEKIFSRLVLIAWPLADWFRSEFVGAEQIFVFGHNFILGRNDFNRVTFAVFGERENSPGGQKNCEDGCCNSHLARWISRSTTFLKRLSFFFCRRLCWMKFTYVRKSGGTDGCSTMFVFNKMQSERNCLLLKNRHFKAIWKIFETLSGIPEKKWEESWLATKKLGQNVFHALPIRQPSVVSNHFYAFRRNTSNLRILLSLKFSLWLASLRSTRKPT